MKVGAAGVSLLSIQSNRTKPDSLSLSLSLFLFLFSGSQKSKSKYSSCGVVSGRELCGCQALPSCLSCPSWGPAAVKKGNPRIIIFEKSNNFKCGPVVRTLIIVDLAGQYLRVPVTSNIVPYFKFRMTQVYDCHVNNSS